MKFEKLLKGGMAALMAVSMAACSNSSSAASATSAAPAGDTTATGSGELSISWWGGDARHEATIAALDAYKTKTGTEVKQTYGAWSGWEDSMATMFSTKTAPDVNQINWNWISQYDFDGSAFLDLNTVADVLDLTQVDQKYLDMCKDANGGQAALPISMTGRIAYWNKTTFEAAGIETPKSLADLEAAGPVFQEKLGEEYYPFYLGEYDRQIFMVTYLESKYGKNWVEDGKLNYSEEEITEGLEFITRLEEEHVIPTIAQIKEDGADSIDKSEKWINGQWAGIYEWDSGASKEKGALAEGQEFEVGVPFEDMGEYQGGFTKVSMAWAISSSTKDPQGAAALVQYLMNDDEATAILTTQRGIPTSKAAYEYCKSNSAFDPDVQEANEKVMAWNSFELDPTFESAALKNTDGVYYDVYDNLSYGTYDTATACQALMEGVNEALEG